MGTVQSKLWRSGQVVATDLTIAEIAEQARTYTDETFWVGLTAPSSDQLEELGNHLGLNPHAIEDALNHVERPKATSFDTYSFVTAYAATITKDPDPKTGSSLRLSRFSAFVFESGIVTIHYDPELNIHEVFQRWQDDASILVYGRTSLLHGILDVITDGYFDVCRKLDDRIEELEDELFNDKPGRALQLQVYLVRKDLLRLRRAVLPMREVVASVERYRRARNEDHALDAYFDDLYDHVLRAGEWTDSLRDVVNSIHDTNMSLQDMQLNKVMRQLAAWAAIIAVPTLITGWFGQNIPFPGFGQLWGVWLSILVAVASVAVLYTTFRAKDWL